MFTVSPPAYALEAAVPAMSTDAYPSRQGSDILGSEKEFPRIDLTPKWFSGLGLRKILIHRTLLGS